MQLFPKSPAGRILHLSVSRGHTRPSRSPMPPVLPERGRIKHDPVPRRWHISKQANGTISKSIMTAICIPKQLFAQRKGELCQCVKLRQEGSLFDFTFSLPNLLADGFTELFPIFHAEISPHDNRQPVAPLLEAPSILMLMEKLQICQDSLSNHQILQKRPTGVISGNQLLSEQFLKQQLIPCIHPFDGIK